MCSNIFETVFEFINAALLPVLLKNDSGTIVYLNQRMCSLIGESFENIIGKRLTDFIHTTSSQALDERDFVLINYEESRDVEITESNVLKNFKFNSKNDAYIIEMAFKISNFKPSEVACKNNGCVYLQLLEKCPTGIGIGSPEGKVIYANEAMEVLFGLSKNGFKKTRINELYSNQSDRDEVLRQLKNDGMMSNVELELKTSFGITFTSMTNMNLINIAGESLIFTYHRDITQRKRTQKALLISEERYRLLVENLQEGLCYIDKQAIINYSNPRMAEIVCRTSSEMIGMSFSRLIEDNQQGFFNEKIEKCLSGSKERFEIELLKPDGSITFASVAARPLFETDGNYRGMLLTMIDLTDQKIAENILRIKEEHYRNLYETITAGIVYLDENGKLLSANPAAEKILGLSSIQMMEFGSSKSLLRAIDESESAIKDTELPGMYALSTGKNVQNRILGVWNHACNRRVWVNMSAVPVFWPGDSKPWQVYVNFVDITEQKEREDELARSERKYQQLIETAHEGYWSLNENGITNFINGRVCDITGYEKDELIDESPMMLMDEKNSAIYKNAFSECFKGFRASYCWELIHKNGRRIFVNASMSPAFDSKGVCCGVTLLIEDFTRQKELEDKIKKARLELFEKFSCGDMIGKSHKMADIFETIPVISEADCNVLIEGESGTGKNLIAKVIHGASTRRNKPFVTVNCGSLPEQLLESELFGYVKGAFTGADRNKPGKFAIAEGGIIFLDEIGEIPLSTQVKLLRIIDEKCFEPIGSNIVEKANVRIVAATNKNLLSMVKAGKFRNDLFYRLNVVNIKMPALKERREDIELLTEYFIRQFNEKYCKNILNISEEILRFFMRYDFPGNIRELKNILERAVIFCNKTALQPSHLDPEYHTIYREMFELNDTRSATLRNKKSGGASPCDYGDIVKTLESCSGNISAAARLLGINRSTLWRKLKNYTFDNTMAKISGAKAVKKKGEVVDEFIKLKNAINEAKNLAAAAKMLGIDRTTLWRKMKKFGII